MPAPLLHEQDRGSSQDRGDKQRDGQRGVHLWSDQAHWYPTSVLSNEDYEHDKHNQTENLLGVDVPFAAGRLAGLRISLVRHSWSF